MHVALQGFLVGLGLAAFLYLFEYMAVRGAANARGKKMAKRPEINQEERSRLRAVTSFCIFMPPGMAIIFWLTMS